jgi:hypothetical protein
VNTDDRKHVVATASLDAAKVASFWAKIDRSGGDDACWPWLRAIDSGGYGQLTLLGKHLRACRLAYELAVGPIDRKLVIDHICNRRACCNPRHLRQVTAAFNALRSEAPNMVLHRLGTCRRGHPLSAAYISRTGTRHCRACRRKGVRR